MPDISMCQGGDCPSRFTCYRHEVKPSPQLQSYGDFLTLERTDGRCLYYWPMYSERSSGRKEK